MRNLVGDFEKTIEDGRKIKHMVGTLETMKMFCDDIKEQLLIECGLLK